VLLLGLFAIAPIFAAPAGTMRVEIDLEEQRAYLLRGRSVLLSSPISSGRYGHLTDTGSFAVIEKERNHFSSIYGKIVDRNGNTVVADADVDMKVPPGGKFIPAPMRYFMRFHGADGMHAGYLPGYAASHGCVRMPEEYAIAFFEAVEVGTPVHVFGRTPRGQRFFQFGRGPQFGLPSFFGNRRSQAPPDGEPVYEAHPVDPRLDPRLRQPGYPWWQ